MSRKQKQDLAKFAKLFKTFCTGKCDPGYHVNLELGGCKACEEGYYSNGGTDISCTCCPHGTTVLSGKGTGEDSCIPSE